MKIVLAVLALRAVAISAAPGSGLDARAVCNRDNCFRAVLASNASPGPAQALSDCSSFLLTTVTPCPTVVTSTAPVQTSTVTEQSTSTSTFVDSETTTVTTTSTVTTTTTVSTITTTPGVQKRDVENLERRATTCPATVTPSAVPAYASACSGTARYSSACSCDGVSASVTTLPQQTSTVTTTPSTTVIVTNVNTATVTSTSQATVSSTTTVTTTVSATATAYPYAGPFFLTEDNSNPVYQVAYDRSSPAVNLRLIRTTSGSGATFNLDTSGHLNSFGYYAAVARSGNDEIPLFSGDQGAADLQCACANYVATTGAFTCSASNGESQFVVCSGGVYHLTFAGSVPAGCSVATFTCHRLNG